ncbi:MAG: transglycosylase SLT domain-containing protein [Bacteroidales bacterium]
MGGGVVDCFDPRTESWAGARGLMQLMPATARELGIINLYSLEASIKAGTKYISYLEEQWSSIPDSSQRVRFILASYNVGLNHVKDAQRLARKNNEDPHNCRVIREYLLKLARPEFYNDPVVQYGYCRGEEPYYYVQEILERYNHYKKFVG